MFIMFDMYIYFYLWISISLNLYIYVYVYIPNVYNRGATTFFLTEKHLGLPYRHPYLEMSPYL